MGSPVVISAAITGAMTVPSQSAHIPITPGEIVQSGLEAAEAGAAIIHVHVREDNGTPSSRLDLFEEVHGKLSAGCDAIIQTTTGGGVGMTIEERSQVVPHLRPEMATFNMGSFNFGIYPIADRIGEWKNDWEADYLESTRDYVFRNTFKDLEYICNLMRANDVKPELEVYDVGHLYNIHHLLERKLLDPPVHVQFVMGVLGSIGPRPEELMHLRARASELLGEHTWSVAGVGYTGEFHLATMSLILGGNVRVGLEDNLRIAPGEMAQSNAQLVEKMVRIANELDRPPASPIEARSLLGIASS